MDFLDDRMARFQKQFIDGLPLKAKQLEDLWHNLRYFKWSDTAYISFQQMVHKIATGIAAAKLSHLSSVASKLDAYLIEHDLVASIELESVDQMVTTLCDLLKKPLAQPPLLDLPLGHSHTTNGKWVFIIDSDHSSAALYATFLQENGYRVKHFDDPSSCFQQLKHQAPHALVYDPNVSVNLQQGYEELALIREQLTKQTPILCVSSRADIHNRLCAMRSGCSCFLAKPFDPIILVNTINQLLNNDQLRHKVLLVDDDNFITQHLSLLLEEYGIEAHGLNQPMKCLQRVAELKPDLVVLDMHMPVVSGLELATLLRQDNQFLLLPIIFVTADSSVRLRRSIEGLGINEVLNKPVDPQAFVHACERAINETAILRQRVSAITQKGRRRQELTRSYFYAALENKLHENDNFLETAAVYYIEMDVSVDFFESHGALEIARIHENFCDNLADLILSDEQWTEIANFTIAILVSQRANSAHSKRVEQLANQLSACLYEISEELISFKTQVVVQGISQKETVNSILKKAEEALLQSRQGNGVIDEEKEQLDPALDFKKLFKDDIPEKNLSICYQPIISLEENYVEHFEALLRWKTDNGELIPAGRFLHYLEDLTRKIELDRWVLQHSVNTIATDSYARENANLFVHLSQVTLEQKLFFSFAANVLRNSRLRGQRRLVFILEEDWIADHFQEAKELVVALSNIQCGTCLSHTGSTGKTISILESITFDYLRLSPQLTKNIDEKNTDTLLDKIISLADELKIKVIASQVEDARQLSLLKQKGARLFQGFIFHAPEQSLKSTIPREFVMKSSTAI